MEQMFFENLSSYNFDTTVSELSEIIAENGWKVIYTHDLQETMRKNGKDVLKAKVIELCKPDYAYQILSEDNLRIYSNMMPCRISVYEKSDGKTYVSRLNSALMSSQIGGIVQEVMSGSFHDAEGFIKKVIEK